MTTKLRLLTTINTVLPVKDYNTDDHVFSQAYGITATDMVYILQALAREFSFTICDDFVDAMEMITFAQFEALLERYQGTAGAA